jgi:glycosyltransferase involved in cell wall biosynthesis
MRVLVAAPYYAPAWSFGGLTTLVLSLCRSIARLPDWSVRVVTSAALSDTEDLQPGEAVVDDIRVTRLEIARGPWPRSYLRMPSLPRTMREQLATSDVALVHGLWTEVDRVAARECLKRGIPYLVYTHGMLTDWALSHHAVRKALYFPLVERHVLARASGIVVSNEAEADVLGARGIEVPIRRIPGGIDMPEDGELTAAPEFASRIGRRPFVLCLARLHPQKGPDLLIDAFAASLARRGFCLVLAGPDDGDYGRQLAQRAERSGVADAVLFTGLATGAEKAWLLRRATIYAQVSRSEGMSVSVLEALAHGLPTLLTAASSFPELAGTAAATTVSSLVPDIARGLEVLSEGRLGVQANRAGPTLMRERFAWPAIARITAEFIRECAGR